MAAEDSGATGTALAALTICESLLIALLEKGVLDDAEREEILEAALDAQSAAATGLYTREEHDQATEIIRRMLVRSNPGRD